MCKYFRKIYLLFYLSPHVSPAPLSFLWLGATVLGTTAVGLGVVGQRAAATGFCCRRLLVTSGDWRRKKSFYFFSIHLTCGPYMS